MDIVHHGDLSLLSDNRRKGGRRIAASRNKAIQEAIPTIKEIIQICFRRKTAPYARGLQAALGETVRGSPDRARNGPARHELQVFPSSEEISHLGPKIYSRVMSQEQRTMPMAPGVQPVKQADIQCPNDVTSNRAIL